jgi:two-component system, OmpR family, phosphate regulon sensor histidine kinase PhoR
MRKLVLPPAAPGRRDRRRPVTRRGGPISGRREEVSALGSIVGRLWAGGLLVGVLLAGGVGVDLYGGIQQQRTIDQLTQVVQPLQVANTQLRSGFSQCQTWYLGYRLTHQGGYLAGYSTCSADSQVTINTTLRVARLAWPDLVPLIRSQQRAADAWFGMADRAAIFTRRAGNAMLTSGAVNSSDAFFAANAKTQQQIDQARNADARAGQQSLARQIRYGGLFIGVVVVSLVMGVAVVVRSAKRLDRAAQEQARLRVLAREAGIRIRANLRADDVIREAITTLERDLGCGMVYIHLMTDGRLGMPQTYQGGPPIDLYDQLPDGTREWAEAVLRQRLVIADLRHSEGLTMPPAMSRVLLSCGYVSGLQLAVGSSDEPLGVIVALRSEQGRPWRPVQIDAIESIVADLGRGLKHAQMYEAEGELVERFRALDKTKTDFIATVSHELRTPLTSITGFVEILRAREAGPLSPDQQRMLDTIDRNASRLRSLIEDVLTMSKIETGAFKTVMRPVRLAEVVSAAVAAMSPTADKGALMLTSDVSDPALVVSGDEDQLDRVMMNLLSNAVKFTPPGGRVTVSANRDNGTALVRVADTGIGIPDKDKKDLFKRFFRASNAVRAAVPGSGLGLSIVRAIIANHGGDLDFQSREGGGTTVTIRLPLVGSKQAQ